MKIKYKGLQSPFTFGTTTMATPLLRKIHDIVVAQHKGIQMFPAYQSNLNPKPITSVTCAVKNKQRFTFLRGRNGLVASYEEHAKVIVSVSPSCIRIYAGDSAIRYIFFYPVKVDKKYIAKARLLKQERITLISLDYFTSRSCALNKTLETMNEYFCVANELSKQLNTEELKNEFRKHGITFTEYDNG